MTPVSWIVALRPSDEDIAKSLSSIKYALDYLLDNFVIISKKEFNGISGYFCKKCLTFEYRYITNIWDDVTVEFDHIDKFNDMTSDVDRSVKESEQCTNGINKLVIRRPQKI